MEKQDSFVVDDADETGDTAIQADWSDSGDAVGASAEADPNDKAPTRVNLAARRAIEEYQERKRLRELLGDDLLDL